MSSSYLNLVINILLMAFAIFSVLELVYDYDKSVKGSFFTKIRRRGWYLILFAILSVVFNYCRDRQSEIKQEESDKAKATTDLLLQASQKEISQIQLSTKDSIIKTINNTYTNSIKASNEALVKYNLKITDSMRAVVSRLKLEATNPQLLIAPSEKGKQIVYIKNDNGVNRLYIILISKGGTCYNILIKCYIIKGSVENGVAGLLKDITILKSGSIGVGESFLTQEVESNRAIDLSPEILDKSELIVFLTGSFSKDPQGKLIVPYNELFIFNFKDNLFINKYEIHYSILKEYIEANKLK